MSIDSAINSGNILVIKSSCTSGGSVGITYIEGSGATRGVPPRGSSCRTAPLEIWSPDDARSLAGTVAGRRPPSRAYSSFTTTFDYRGVAIIQFLYDYSQVPQTSQTRSGFHFSRFVLSVTGVAGVPPLEEHRLHHRANILDVSGTFRNVKTPSLAIPGVWSDALSMATSTAHRLAAASNSLSRHSMDAIVILDG